MIGTQYVVLDILVSLAMYGVVDLAMNYTSPQGTSLGPLVCLISLSHSDMDRRGKRLPEY